MLRLAESLEETQNFFENVSFADCKDPETMKKVFIDLRGKFNGIGSVEVRPSWSLEHTIRLLEYMPPGSLIIRKSSEADTIALSVKGTYSLISHHRFKNKAADNANMPPVANPILLFVNKSGETIETVIAQHFDSIKKYWDTLRRMRERESLPLPLPPRPKSPEYHKDNSSPIMIVSTQYSALKTEEDQTMVRLGGTGEAIQKNVGGGLTRMHRDQSANAEDIALFKRHLHPEGLLIITGHGSDASQNITGEYITDEQQAVLNDPSIKKHSVSHTPATYVSMVMQGETLPRGSHLNILLYVCKAAVAEDGNISLAEEFANAFAVQGISTTIMATTGIMGRISNASKIMGDTPGAAIMIRNEADDFKVFISKVSLNGEIIQREQKSYTERFIITPIGCGPRSEIEECWLKGLEKAAVDTAQLNHYVNMLNYFFANSEQSRDQAHEARIERAKRLFLNLASELRQIILEKVKSFNPALHLCLSAMTSTSVSTAFTFKLPTPQSEPAVNSLFNKTI